MSEPDQIDTPMPPEVAEAIRRQISCPDKVQVTERAKYDMMACGLTTAGVCDALAEWLSGGGSLRVIVTQSAPGHVGEHAYVGRPVLCGREYYVKVAVQAAGTRNERLLIVSAHESN